MNPYFQKCESKGLGEKRGTGTEQNTVMLTYIELPTIKYMSLPMSWTYT